MHQNQPHHQAGVSDSANRQASRHSSVPSSVMHEACIAFQHASAHIHPPISHQSILAMSASIWPGAVVEGYLHMHAGRCCRAGCCEVLLQKRQGDVARLLMREGSERSFKSLDRSPAHHLPFLVYQELGEVPLDVVVEDTCIGGRSGVGGVGRAKHRTSVRFGGDE